MTKECSGDAAAAASPENACNRNKIIYNTETSTAALMSNSNKKRARTSNEVDDTNQHNNSKSHKNSSPENGSRSHNNNTCSVVVCNNVNIIHNPAKLPQTNDVLLGHSDWPGTVYFEQLLETYRDAYVLQAVTVASRTQLVNEIIQVIGKLEPPGRFFLKTLKGDWIRLFGRDTIKKMVYEALHEVAKRQLPKKPKLSKEFLYNLYTTTEYTMSCGQSPTSVIAHEIRHQQQIDLRPAQVPRPPPATAVQAYQPTHPPYYHNTTCQDNVVTGGGALGNGPPVAAAASGSSTAAPIKGVGTCAYGAEPHASTTTGKATAGVAERGKRKDKDKQRNHGIFKRDTTNSSAAGGAGPEGTVNLPDNIPRGVTQRPSGKWQAQIYFVGQSRYLGVYKECVAASLAFETASAFLKGRNKTNKNTFIPKEEALQIFAKARREANRQVIEQLGRIMLVD